MDLGDLFKKYGSDKDVNGYTAFYAITLDHLREREMTILEIGIGTMLPDVPSSMHGYAREGYEPGGSLRAWRDYFVNSELHGIDIQPDTIIDDEERVTTHVASSLVKAEVDAFIQSFDDDFQGFDIIIDDGSHIGEDQLMTLKHFYPHLKPEGYYIIEDITDNSVVVSDSDQVGKIVNEDPFYFGGKRNNLCIIWKHALPSFATRENY